MIGSPVVVSPEVAAFHGEALVIDLHNDVLTKLSHVSYKFDRRHRPAVFWNPARLDLDIPRIRAGGIDTLGCLMFAGFRMQAARRFWRQLDEAQRLVAAHPEELALVASPADLRAARSAGRIALFLGVEGSYVVEKDIEPNLSRLASAGARFLGPLWERDSGAGSSCRAGDDKGLSDLGRTLVGACNQRGISLDVAHASRKTFWDIASVSSKPIFSSHSGADGVYAHPRNLDDAQIREIARRGGIVGVIFVSPYLGGTFCTVARIADHIEHVARVGG